MSGLGQGGWFYPFGCSRPSVGPARVPACNSKTGLSSSMLGQPLSAVRGAGKDTVRRLKALGLETVGDLLLHLPFRHESAAGLTEIASLSEGEEVNLRVRILSCAVRETSRRRIKVLEALVSDHTGSVVAVWYNQPYLEAAFRHQPEVLLRGILLRKRRQGPIFVVKRHELLGTAEESKHVLGLIPVYSSTGDLSVRTIRNLLHAAAPFARHLADPLPAELLARRRYPSKAEAVLCCHFPAVLADAAVGRERLAFEELFLLQMAILRRRRLLDREQKALPLPLAGDLTTRFLAKLPFRLTTAQLRVLAEIDADLGRAIPMRRLLHGDVGSGKTVIAAYSLLRAVENGGQAALMAPTEVLADQHYLGLAPRLAEEGVRVGLLKGGLSASERRALRAAVAKGELDVLIGTHALIQEGVRFHDLRVVVIDEQHRFGVRQREAMLVRDEQGRRPHTLHMSATPIPRTLSLTLYGDLDVSVLDELPPGRQKVKTRLVFPEAQGRMWEFVRRQLARHRQAYIVCPLIEESEALQTASATETFAVLAAGELRGFRLGLLHGQLPAAEKAKVMGQFAQRELEVLVSTSVIEVGIDVPNATLMIILGARHFGLSQLHQLRGRVGRGDLESYCFLPVGEEDAPALDRLALFARTSDGFALAEADLLIRGTGELFGERQSGVGDLQVASLVRDRYLLEEARAEALGFLVEWEGLQDRREAQPPLQTASHGERLIPAASKARQVLYLPAVEAAEARFGAIISKMERA